VDSFDRKILAALEQDARQSISAIAGQVNLSRSAVSERIRRMEENGDILGYRVITRPQAGTRTTVRAFFENQHKGYNCETMTARILAIPGVVCCYGISGEVDLLIEAEAESMEALHQLRKQLDQIPDIGKVTTHIVMGQWRR